MQKKNQPKVIVVLPAVFCSNVITGSLAGFFYLIRDTDTKFNVLVKWLEIGSRRTPLLNETLPTQFCWVFSVMLAVQITHHMSII